MAGGRAEACRKQNEQAGDLDSLWHPFNLPCYVDLNHWTNNQLYIKVKEQQTYRDHNRHFYNDSIDLLELNGIVYRSRYVDSK